MEQIQITGLSDQLKKEITEDVVKGVTDSLISEITELKKEFQPKEPTKYLQRSDVAEMLKVDISTVHNWCKRGILQPLQIGGRIYFKRSQVEEQMVELNK